MPGADLPFLIIFPALIAKTLPAPSHSSVGMNHPTFECSLAFSLPTQKQRTENSNDVPTILHSPRITHVEMQHVLIPPSMGIPSTGLTPELPCRAAWCTFGPGMGGNAACGAGCAGTCLPRDVLQDFVCRCIPLPIAVYAEEAGQLFLAILPMGQGKKRHRSELMQSEFCSEKKGTWKAL